MAREFFKNLPDTTTPLNAQRMNSFLDGEESMGSIVVEDITCKNLFDVNNLSYELGYYDDNGNLVSSAITGHSLDFIKVDANTNYTISGNVYTNREGYAIAKVYFWDANKTFLSRTDFITSKTSTFTTPANTKYITLQVITEGWYSEAYLYNLQIEKGTVATDYVKHKEIDSTGLRGKYLWINPNPTEAMAYQYGGITLTSSDYDVLEFYFYTSTDNKVMTVQKVMAGYGAVGMYINGYGGLVYSRAISYVSKTSYTINECYRYGYGATTPPAGSNTFLIPAYVIGYKNSIGTNPTTSTASVEE